MPRYLQGPCPNGSGDDIPRVDYVKRFAVITNPTEYAADFTKHLAASGQDNPLTLSDIKNYLVRTGQEVVIDPHTNEEFDVAAWLTLDRGLGGPGGLPARVLEQIPTMDTGNSMNYERNYLAAIYAHYPYQAQRARWDFEDEIRQRFGDDSAAVYGYLQTLDLMGTETE